MVEAPSLPDLDALDIAALKALILAQQKQHAHALRSHTSEIEHLKLQVEKLRRMLFGGSSEKIRHRLEQLEFELEELEAAAPQEEATTETPSSEAPARRPHRLPLPAHLPREVRTYAPSHQTCPDCGGKLQPLGEDVAEMLVYVRACFKVIRHVRPKLSCAACDCIVQAPAPSRPIDRGLAGPGLLAHLLVSKYADHQPLYRQSEIYARATVSISTVPRSPAGSAQVVSCSRL